MEDDRVAIIEAQLAQAKQIADEADRKYEEVNIRGIGLNQACQFSRLGSPGLNPAIRHRAHTLLSSLSTLFCFEEILKTF